MIMLVAGAMLIYTSPRMFLAVVWLVPLLWLANRIFFKKSGVIYQVAREGWTRVSTNLAENITGMRVVTAFNRQDPTSSSSTASRRKTPANNVRVARVNGIYQPSLAIIGFIGRATILLYGGYLIASGQIGNKGVGAIIAAYLYWDHFMNPVLNLGDFYNQLMMAMAGGGTRLRAARHEAGRTGPARRAPDPAQSSGA
jgi:ABC-type multidrug transport system fused ATPase/permease subunit